jgi:hypothetical protein
MVVFAGRGITQKEPSVLFAFFFVAELFRFGLMPWP